MAADRTNLTGAASSTGAPLASVVQAATRDDSTPRSCRTGSRVPGTLR